MGTQNIKQNIKLIIQIPCFNEESTLETTLRDLPKAIDHIDTIETLVIDDGSTDRTVEKAEQMGVNHIISFNNHKGLASAFSAGIEKSIALGADIIVNTDADNQYCGSDIPQLIMPIVEGRADVVVGDRQTDEIPHFSWIKRKLQKWGSALVRRLSRVRVKDAASGFRAYSREAALHMNMLTDYSYTIESLIQLGNKNLNIVSIPIRTNEKLRESRLIKSVPGFLANQATALLRVYATYKALRVFIFLGILLTLPGLFGFLRFLYFYFTGRGAGHVQSLIFSAVFILIGFFVLMFGIIADLIGSNRKLIESAIYRIKNIESNGEKQDHSD